MSDTTTDLDGDFWRRLRAPFPPEEVEKKPQTVFGKDIAEKRGKCRQGVWVETKWGDRPVSMDEWYCGGSHTPAIHIDYIGHAGLTMRLNDVCSPAGWDWEPVSTTPEGWPLIANGGMWIKLTITPPSGVAVSKLGFGDMGNSTGTQGVKEVIGDALRNAAMRFGIATYLWSKSERAKTAADVADVPAPPVRVHQQEVPHDIEQGVDEPPRPPSDDPRDAPPNPLPSDQFRRWFEEAAADWTHEERHAAVVEAVGLKFNTGTATTSQDEWAELLEAWQKDGIPPRRPR